MGRKERKEIRKEIRRERNSISAQSGIPHIELDTLEGKTHRGVTALGSTIIVNSSFMPPLSPGQVCTLQYKNDRYTGRLLRRNGKGGVVYLNGYQW